MVLHAGKKFLLIFLLVVFSFVIVFFLVYKKEKRLVYTSVPVKQGTIIQTVSEVGSVKSAQRVDLSFLNTGRIAKIYVQVGDKVKKGEVLAELDFRALQIKKEEILANLDLAKQNLAKLLAGATKEEVAIARADVEKAKTAMNRAEEEFETTKKEAEESVRQAQKTVNDLESDSEDNVTSYEQAISNASIALDNAKISYQKPIQNYKINTLNTVEKEIAVANSALNDVDKILNDDDAESLLGVKNLTLLHSLTLKYDNAKNELLALKNQLNSTQSSVLNDDYIDLGDSALSVFGDIFDVLDLCYSVLENTITSSDFTETNLESYKTTISTDQSSVSGSISSVESVKQGLNNAIIAYNTNVSSYENKLKAARVAYQDALKNAQNALSGARLNGDKVIAMAESKLRTSQEAYKVALAHLNKVLAKADKHDVALARAKIRQAEASLDSVKNEIENSIIKSPIDGVVVEFNYDLGEQVALGKTVVSVLENSDYDIEVLISESDIEKVKKNQDVNITLDAFGDDFVFAGKVYFIEPAQTEVQDVIYYKVDIVFNPEGKNIKPGMTANVDIITAQKDNVLIVPMRAIIEKNKKKYVRLLQGKTYKEQEIKTGIYGDDSLVEVVSGLKKGDLVILRIQEK